MKKITLGLLMSLGLFGQQMGVNTLIVNTPPPTGVQQSFVSNTGVQGQTSYCYYVVAVYPVGMAQPTMTCTGSANATLDGNNFNVISWNAPVGGSPSGYWVIRTTGGGFPGSGTNAVNAVVLANTVFTLNDQSNALNAFVFAPTNWASANLYVANGDETLPSLRIANSQGLTMREFTLVPNGINGFTSTPGTAGNPVVLGVDITTDTNVGIRVQPKGTGPFTVLPTANTSPNASLQVVGVASAVNGVNVTPTVTTGSPVIAAIGADASIDLSLTGKGAGSLAKISGPDYHFQGNVTVAQINAGVVIVPDVVGRTWRLDEVTFQAVGGAITGCTLVQVTDTTPTVAIGFPVAVLTSGGIASIGSANVVFTTFAWQGVLGAGKGLQINKTGGNCATATSMNYLIAAQLN